MCRSLVLSRSFSLPSPASSSCTWLMNTFEMSLSLIVRSLKFTLKNRLVVVLAGFNQVRKGHSFMLPPVLEIYIAWHPGDAPGRTIAGEIVEHFHGTAFTGLIGGAV